MSATTLDLLKSGQLAGAKQLKISAGLTEFPLEIFTLADSLEILDLTGNALTSLPGDLHRLKKLRILFCSQNQFTELPPVLGQCESLSMVGFKANQISHIPESAIPTKNLRWFIVTDNALKQVPDALGECKKLQKLMLAGNQLTTLPETMAKCEALELLRISANQLTELPDWIPNLPKLTWLAYAGNPMSEFIEGAQLKKHQVTEIDWQAITLGKVLGEGASGTTYQAVWHHGDHDEQVAVKLFKSGLTSDGLPISEVNANLIAGEHEHLVGVKGMVVNHPEDLMCLVMPLLKADLKVLANPPSFDSCTRDVYPPETQLSKQQMAHISNGVASALLHLHAKGLTHGDLYAHNILWNDYEVILSDLGGASCLPLQDAQLTEALTKLDVRAYHILMEELARMTA